MDMSVPKEIAAASDARTHATLTRIGRVLGCSPERFFEVPSSGCPKDTSQVIQIWLAIRSPEARDAIYAFAREVLRLENG